MEILGISSNKFSTNFSSEISIYLGEYSYLKNFSP